jgi:hypothetical protein
MVQAVHDFRGTYNVSDYRWFDLRDHRTSSQNFQHQYGLLRDDYTPKPAFDRYRVLLDRFASRPGKPRLAIARPSGRCSKGRTPLRLEGPDVPEVLRARIAGRTDDAAPFAWTTRLAAGRRERVVRLAAAVEMVDARRATVVRHVRVCTLG